MEQLIRDIVAQVVRELRARPLGPDQTGLPARPACPRIRVLATRNEALVSRVLERTGEAELIFDGEERASEPCSRHLLPDLGCSAMAELAAGSATEPCLRDVLNCLLHGVTVEVLDFAYHAHRETAPGPLYRLYEAYEQTLADFGLVAFRVPTPEVVRQWDDLVTAAMVEQAAATGTGTLMVRADAKVTPLAQDAANRLNLHIVKQL